VWAGGRAGGAARPYPADAMRAYPVGSLVNNPRNDRPECLAPAQEATAAPARPRRAKGRGRVP
jgi:hypothetical protein